MKRLKWLLENLKKLINIIDTPFDKLKTWLWRDRPIKNGWRYRIRVPMKNNHYYGFEIAIYNPKKSKGEKKCH